jgi:hypothetical protein
MSPDLDRTTQCAPQLKSPLRTALRDVYSGFVGLTHNGMAIAGMLLATVVITLSARPDLRQVGERELLTWLQYRQEAEMSTEQVATIIAEPGAAERATALIPTNLPKQQANVAYWLSKKYRVAPEPLGVLVAEAFNVGERVRLDPTLLLAVMAIESRFNPFAQSPVGAQGLMQVLTKVHTDKYEDFGGRLAAFDPVSNLRVGAKVLHDCVKRAGSIEGGLRLYVGAVSSDGSGYINKVMAEHLRIQSVALGKPMPRVFPVYRPEPVAETPEAPIMDTAALGEPSAQTIESLSTQAPMVNVDTVIKPKSDSETIAMVRS